MSASRFLHGISILFTALIANATAKDEVMTRTNQINEYTQFLNKKLLKNGYFILLSLFVC